MAGLYEAAGGKQDNQRESSGLMVWGPLTLLSPHFLLRFPWKRFEGTSGTNVWDVPSMAGVQHAFFLLGLPQPRPPCGHHSQALPAGGAHGA